MLTFTMNRQSVAHCLVKRTKQGPLKTDFSPTRTLFCPIRHILSDMKKGHHFIGDVAMIA
jgi:hypothetical protein